MVVTVDGSKNKIKLFIINYKMILFRNILNNYLIYMNFKNVYYHLYKINFFFAKQKRIFVHPHGSSSSCFYIRWV